MRPSACCSVLLLGMPNCTRPQGSVVAVKVLAKDVSAEDVERFRREAELALEIDHDNIIRVLDLVRAAGIDRVAFEIRSPTERDRP